MTAEPDADRRRFRDVLYEALAGDSPSVRDATPQLLLSRLVEETAPRATDEASRGLLAGLDAVARESDLGRAVIAAEASFDMPERFREAIYFARCLNRDAAGAIALLEGRRYIEGAIVPPPLPDLRTDRDAVLDATTFSDLWREASRLDWMLNTIAIWRRDYAAAYASEHASYNIAVATIADAIDVVVPQAAALERLNSLRRLGPPLAVAALLQFHELERLFACPLDARSLNDALAAAPICPECAFRLGDDAPTAEAQRVRQAVERALSGQQARLARRVVSRLLSRPAAEDKVSRFIQVVQASDLTGLAFVLDDALIEFLRDLLETPADEPDIFQRLTYAFPEVTPATLEAAVHEFRRLLEEGLAREGGSLQLNRSDRT
jgi:hypothetical protein